MGVVASAWSCRRRHRRLVLRKAGPLSLSTIFTVALPLASVAPTGVASATVKVSSASPSVSFVIGIAIVFDLGARRERQRPGLGREVGARGGAVAAWRRCS